MSNTSATGGYLTPDALAPPAQDDALAALFQQAVAAITGLPGNLVRPLWQPGNPKTPEPTTTWAALGVTTQTADAGPYIGHQAAGNGADEMQRHEDIELQITFYGPQGQNAAALLRDGLAMPQNIEQLSLANIKFVDLGPPRAAPELFNQQWVRRYDLTARFRRKVSRTYGVLNILSATPELISDEIGTISN